MSALTDFDLDETGKIDLSRIYDRPDPRDYYQTLVNLDYCIPGEAESLFRAAVEAYRKARGRQRLKVVDVGSSYGVNGAILKHGFRLADLFRHYGAEATGAMSRRELLARDRGLFVDNEADELTVIGLDPAEPAVAYARECGILDGYITSDLEQNDPRPDERALLAGTDLVISTGAIGYVGAPTFERILDASEGRPWFALFALRMFPVAAIADALRARGYAMWKLDGNTFRQRRFAGRDERAEVLANLERLDIDPAGCEGEGWYHAEFFFARPADEDCADPVDGLVPV